jgi:hypothetical protein
MASPSSWICPNCQRRVPRYSPVCHCGARQADVARVSARPGIAGRPGVSGARGVPGRAWDDLPGSVRMLLGVAVLLVLVIVALLFVPPTPPPRLPLLAVVDHPPRTPALKR